jgi:tetratricopeptide (TPR) repeat protein
MKRTGLLITILVIVLGLGGAYVAGSFILPNAIKLSYQNENCEQTLSLVARYTSLYSVFAVDKSIQDLAKECALYVLATESEEKQAWIDTYNAYQSYKQNYPQGILAHEADERSALALTGWIQDDMAAKKYGDALKNAILIQKSFGTTEAATHTNDTVAQVYAAWAKNLQKTGHFTEAEKTVKEFKGWAQSIKNEKYTQAAELELAQTYLAWGQTVQGQKQFEDAKLKFELAISTDPHPSAKSGPAVHAKAALPKLYAEWGDALISSDDFTDAMDRYQTSISLAEPDEQLIVKEKIFAAYLQWALSISNSGDFLGALKKVDDVEKNAGTTNENKKAIADAKAQIYLAFSQSTGPQAKQAMQDAAQAICDNRKPSLPIFGTDSDKVQAVLYGLKGSLSEATTAKTPGSMHYVVCVEEKPKIIETKTFNHTLTNYTLTREVYEWHITLWDMTKNTVITTTKISGGMPSAIPEFQGDTYVNLLSGQQPTHIYGSSPILSDLEDWLLTIIK